MNFYPISDTYCHLLSQFDHQPKRSEFILEMDVLDLRRFLIWASWCKDAFPFSSNCFYFCSLTFWCMFSHLLLSLFVFVFFKYNHGVTWLVHLWINNFLLNIAIAVNMCVSTNGNKLHVLNKSMVTAEKLLASHFHVGLPKIVLIFLCLSFGDL